MIVRVDPQNQIKLNHKIVERLLKSYDLRLISFEEVESAGVKNISAFLHTDKGIFVLKVYRRNNKKPREISQEMRFTDFLRGHGAPIPQVLSNSKGELISRAKIDGLVWTYILMEFIEGGYLDHRQYDLMPAMAKYQALMHNASYKFEKAEKFDTLKNSLDNFVSYDKKAEKHLKSNPLYSEIRKMISRVILDLENNFDEISDLSSGLANMDYESDNILVHKNKITAILDFDDLSYQPFIADIGISLWWWLFMNKAKDSGALLDKYVKGYRKHRNLSKKELEFLPLFIRTRNVTVAMYDLGDEKSQKEWKKLLDFDALLKRI